MNVFCFTGNLGKDAETRFTQAGKAICSFSVAVRSGFGEHEKTTWVKCILFGKRAEGALPQCLTKGQKVAIDGEATLAEWQDKEGNTRNTLEVVVDGLDLIGSKEGSGSGQNRQGNSLDDLNKGAGGYSKEPDNAADRQRERADPFADAPAFGDVPVDDDIPF